MTILDNISYSQALEVCLQNVEFKNIHENIYINNALNRILAVDIIAKRNSPIFTNSAMDGFAFKHSKHKKLKVIKTIYAGDKYDNFNIKEDECVRIMTGAKVPEGLDTIIPIEKCKEVTDQYIVIPEIKKGANVRLKGEEITKGKILIKKGEIITPETIAMLVSQGIVNIPVYTKLKIAILSTGNELKEPWENADEEEIYNINSYSIHALLKKFGFESDIIGLIPDSLEKTIEYIKNLKNRYDVIITSGGISFGDADYLYEAFKQNGLKEFFHGIMVKPGRPTMAGKMENTLVFAMPGNPLSAYINTFCLAIPTLKKLNGANKYYFQSFNAVNKTEFKVNPKKDHTILGFYKNGEWEVFNGYKYGSGMLTPLIQSNSIMLLNKGREHIKAGEIIKIIPYNAQFDNVNFTFN
ncbi:molybdopterin molybdotransferase MoeA [Nautilia lithotrophica]